MKRVFVVVLVCMASLVNAQKKDTKKQQGSLDSIQKLDEIIISPNKIFGNKYVAKNRTGSAYYLSSQELQKFNFTDINRVLRSVPGVSIYEEDGFGLRPNISLRGTSPERSAKISIMEDGVLIAPAPYSAPSAYYFPSIARMQAVEILKGSSQVQYGPFTTGGAINMVSREIPNEFSGAVRANYGSFNSSQLHANIGGVSNNIGYMVEYLNFNSDGFKTLPNGGNTGFDKNDVVAKLSFALTEKQLIEAKFQYSDEVSNETYLGLTEADFSANPFARYAGSQYDVMRADHNQIMLSHIVNFTKNIRLTTTLYQNKFARNWYKLDDIIANGEKVGISSVIANPSVYPDHINIVNGSTNTATGALVLKANNRKYLAQGIQTKFDYHWYGDETFHDIEVGLRYHYDEEDRFQWEDGYAINNGVMQLIDAGAPGSDANRISSATAFAAYAMYKLKYKKLTLTPGIRYENIDLSRENFGTADPNRTGSNLSTRTNNVAIVIPGIGANYSFSSNMSLFGGIHKGFSPPGNQVGQKAEESVNFELGSRFNVGGLQGEVVAYYNDYSNLLGSDLAATGGTGSLDQFNAGEVAVRGLEVLLNYDFLSKNANYSLPFTFGYTLTDTEFLNSFGSNDDLWGVVTRGDELPYISKHQFNTSLSLEHKKFQINTTARYISAFRTKAGNGAISADEKVDSNFIVDLSGKYFLNQNWTLTSNIINLFDTTYAVSRVPAGLRPGHPFGMYVGVQYQF